MLQFLTYSRCPLQVDDSDKNKTDVHPLLALKRGGPQERFKHFCYGLPGFKKTEGGQREYAQRLPLTQKLMDLIIPCQMLILHLWLMLHWRMRACHGRFEGTSGKFPFTNVIVMKSSAQREVIPSTTYLHVLLLYTKIIPRRQYKYWELIVTWLDFHLLGTYLFIS